MNKKRQNVFPDFNKMTEKRQNILQQASGTPEKPKFNRNHRRQLQSTHQKLVPYPKKTNSWTLYT